MILAHVLMTLIAFFGMSSQSVHVEQVAIGLVIILYAGIGTIIFIVFYTLGMAFKLYKIYRGEYIEEEPVFLKYK